MPEAPFDHLIGSIDRRDPCRGDLDEFLRQPTCDQPVRVIVGDQLPVALPDLLKRLPPLDAKNNVRIAGTEIDVTRQDRLVMRLVDPEDLGDAMQELPFPLVDQPVCLP